MGSVVQEDNLCHRPVSIEIKVHSFKTVISIDKKYVKFFWQPELNRSYVLTRICLLKLPLRMVKSTTTFMVDIYRIKMAAVSLNTGQKG